MVNQHLKCRGSYLALSARRSILRKWLRSTPHALSWTHFSSSAVTFLFLSCACLPGWHQCHLSDTFSAPLPTHYINCSLSRAPAATEKRQVSHSCVKCHTGCEFTEDQVFLSCLYPQAKNFPGFRFTVNWFVCMVNGVVCIVYSQFCGFFVASDTEHLLPCARHLPDTRKLRFTEVNLPESQL